MIIFLIRNGNGVHLLVVAQNEKEAIASLNPVIHGNCSCRGKSSEFDGTTAGKIAALAIDSRLRLTENVWLDE